MDKDCFNGAAGISPEFQTTTTAAMAVQWNAPNCPSELGFLNSSLDQYSHFDSSSFTSANDGFFFRHLIGKLGGASLPPPTTAAHVMDDTNLKIQFPVADQINHNLGNPGTLAPATAPPLPSISADPGFIERAAKFSCFGSRSFNGRTSSIGHGSKSTNPLPTPPLLSGSKLPRVSSSPVLKPDQALMESKPTGLSDRKSGKMTGSGSNSNDESSVSEQIPTSEMSKKRKAISRPKSKEEGSPNPTKADKEDENVSNPKRSKSNNTETDKKPPEPPKDYIHVRARRGQATDSHSLAERVRREKISERMKLLQDLVPGCNKVTGKALMLDEIINYVQSLQRQVEFLSMKLASVNPSLDFNMETLLSKDVNVNINMLQQSSQQMYTGAQEVQLYQHNVQHDSSSSSISISRGPLMDPLLHFDTFTENFHQFPGFNEDDLNSIVQMGFANFPVPNMKIER